MPTRRHRAWRPRSSCQGGYSESLCASRETERSVRDTLSRSLLLVRDGHAAAGCCARACPASAAVDDASFRPQAAVRRSAAGVAAL